MRFLANRPITLTHTFLDDETVMTVTNVTVTVTRSALTATTNETATATATDGVWAAPIPALGLGVYTASWTCDEGVTDTDVFEVVGADLFTIPDARNFDADLSSARFSADQIKRAREAITEEFERITGRSFVPRARVITTRADAAGQVQLGKFDIWQILAVTIDGTPVDADTLASFYATTAGFLEGKVITPGLVDDGWIDFPVITSPTRPVTREGSVVEVEYVYGFNAVPSDVHDVALLRLRSLISRGNSQVPDRATTFQPTDGGTFTLATPGKGGSETGIPDVDATLARYRYDVLSSVLGMT